MLRITLLVLASLLYGCGLKGNLYLPDKSKPVITTPAQSSASSSASASSVSSAP